MSPILAIMENETCEHVFDGFAILLKVGFPSMHSPDSMPTCLPSKHSLNYQHHKLTFNANIKGFKACYNHSLHPHSPYRFAVQGVLQSGFTKTINAQFALYCLRSLARFMNGVI